MPRKIVLLILCLVLAGPVFAKKKRASSGKKSDRGAATAETLELVNYVLKTETSELDPEIIPYFMEVEELALPGPLRWRVRAKKTELNAMLKIAEGKRKPPLRRLGMDPEDAVCEDKHEDKKFVDALKTMGFSEITDDEELFLMKRTRCSECELQEEFSLIAVVVPAKWKKGKKGKPTRHLFLSEKDPLMALVGLYRAGSDGTTGTNFFGVGMVPACH